MSLSLPKTHVTGPGNYLRAKKEQPKNRANSTKECSEQFEGTTQLNKGFFSRTLKSTYITGVPKSEFSGSQEMGIKGGR